jgi:hypothetical protein
MVRVASLRASDADREQVADRLRHATGEGRLSTDELEERLEALPAARTYGELSALIADLPASPSPRRERPRVPRWVGAAGAVTVMVVLFGALAGVVRHFAVAVHLHAGPLAGAAHMLIAAAFVAAAFVAVAVICGILLSRWVRSRRTWHS